MASVGVKFWSWIRLNKRLKCQPGDNSTVICLTIWRNLSWTIALVSNLTRFGIVAAFSFTMNRHSFERVPMNRNQRVRVFMAQPSHAKGKTETPKFVLISPRYLWYWVLTAVGVLTAHRKKFLVRVSLDWFTSLPAIESCYQKPINLHQNSVLYELKRKHSLQETRLRHNFPVMMVHFVELCFLLKNCFLLNAGFVIKSFRGNLWKLLTFGGQS